MVVGESYHVGFPSSVSSRGDTDQCGINDELCGLGPNKWPAKASSLVTGKDEPWTRDFREECTEYFSVCLHVCGRLRQKVSALSVSLKKDAEECESNLMPFECLA